METAAPSDALPVTIVPRWEWRTFGTSFGAADERLAALAPDRVEESDEIYLLALGSDASVKLRGGLVDVKRREQIDDRGLELWRPVMKHRFPVAAADVRTVLETLRADVPALTREAYTLEEVRDEIIQPSAELRAAPVHKRRVRHTIGGCMAEVTEMTTAEGTTRTIAVESEDPDRVIATVRELGLEERPVVCVARGLKALVGFGARRYAVIDVGTNSVKFHVGERAADGAIRGIVDRAEVTRLGEGLDDTGRLSAEPIGRTVDAIAAMADEAGRHGAEAIAAVGTAGLRIAPNAADLLAAVETRSGIRIEVIPGEDEARLAYLAAKAGLGPRFAAGAIVVFDTGGGSSQFTFGRGGQVDERFSVNVGAVRLTERFGLDGVVSDDALAAALTAIGEDLAALDGRARPDAVVGMGGAVTNLAAVRHGLATYDPEVVQGTVLDADEIDRQIGVYRERTADARREIVGLQPNRAEVILAGACIVRTVLAKLGRDALTVSDRGLRHGVALERFGA